MQVVPPTAQRRLVTAGAAILALMAVTVGPARAEDTRQIVVDLRDDTTDADEAALEALADGADLRLNSIHADDERLFIADVPADQVAAILERLADDPRVEYAERNYQYHLIDPVPAGESSTSLRPAKDTPDPAYAPNDPLWAKQWSFRMVNAAKAWSVAQGTGVVVAVIDTGVAFENHKGFKKVEDLGGTDFVAGYDFVRDTDHPNDDHGHGTHVAGTIAQTTNNGLGVAGIAPRAKIMPLKVLSRRGSGTAADIADAIRFAADEGAHVINMSLGGGMRSSW